jgi:hypothetical protein
MNRIARNRRHSPRIKQRGGVAALKDRNQSRSRPSHSGCSNNRQPPDTF